MSNPHPTPLLRASRQNTNITAGVMTTQPNNIVAQIAISQDMVLPLWKWQTAEPGDKMIGQPQRQRHDGQRGRDRSVGREY